jgi:hypothetical protein
MSIQRPTRSFATSSSRKSDSIVCCHLRTLRTCTARVFPLVMQTDSQLTVLKSPVPLTQGSQQLSHLLACSNFPCYIHLLHLQVTYGCQNIYQTVRQHSATTAFGTSPVTTGSCQLPRCHRHRVLTQAWQFSPVHTSPQLSTFFCDTLSTCCGTPTGDQQARHDNLRHHAF